MQLSSGVLLRPWFRVGATIFEDTSSTISATFQGAPTGISPFRFTTKLDKSYADVAAGLNILWDTDLELRLNYDARFSDNSEEHSGGIKLGLKF